MKTTTIACKIVQTTEKAILIHDGSEDKDGYPIGHWIPKTQCDLEELDPDTCVGSMVELEVSEWLAKERGLI
jgi:hypothetical protein